MTIPLIAAEQPGPRQAMAVRRVVLALALVAAIVSGCASPGPNPPPATLAPTAPAALAPTAGPSQLTVYTPATTSSVPVILAARQLSEHAGSAGTAALTVFSNHSQANTLFLRGDIDILVTGLSVGVEFFRNGAPVQVINCNVSGLTYLVTYGRRVNSLAELKGTPVYLPFEGSPIEEITRFFAGQEGLVWNQDIKPVYAASDSALALLKQGKASAVALPEPFVSLAEGQAEVYVSLSYRERWNALTGSTQGYPQVCAFAMRSWAAAHPETIAAFNEELATAVRLVQRDPATAAEQAKGALGFSREILLSSLGRTGFEVWDSDEMAQAIRRYYQIVGKPLDVSYDPFFYR